MIVPITNYTSFIKLLHNERMAKAQFYHIKKIFHPEKYRILH